MSSCGTGEKVIRRKREKLVAAAQLSLERLHPGYGTLVGKFIARDPLKTVRAKLDADRVAADARAKILCLGDGSKGGYSDGDNLMVQLIPDVGPFWGACRPTIPTFPSAPNLPRISDHTPVERLAQLMADLHIEMLYLDAKASWLPKFGRNLISAARKAGVIIDRTRPSKAAGG